jgi:branched-subunit amino acid transport protein
VEDRLILLTIIGMALVTYLPRLIPLLALSGKYLPQPVVAWLRHVPPAVLAAMLLPIILMPEGTITLGLKTFFLGCSPDLCRSYFVQKFIYPRDHRDAGGDFRALIWGLDKWALNPEAFFQGDRPLSRKPLTITNYCSKIPWPNPGRALVHLQPGGLQCR